MTDLGLLLHNLTYPHKKKYAILFLTLLPKNDNRNKKSNMQYPLISEYVDAIRLAEDNFDKLRNLRPVLDYNGNPIMSSGNFAVVFKMKDVNTGKLYAIKCFIKEQEGRKEAYQQIVDELEFVQSTYLAKVKYYDNELFVDTQNSDSNEFPVLLMDWVDGVTLDRYIRQNINDKYTLEMLAYNFSRLVMWLLPQPFAHGDLKPDNIFVHDDGSLTLIDYDGMFVPAMQGQKSRELGSPDFRHPLRTKDDFNEQIDDFSAISILLSLRLIAFAPSFFVQYGASDRLLFSENDYRNLSSCNLLKSVFPSQDTEINTLISLFTIACIHKTLERVSFKLLMVNKPNKSKTIKKHLSTKVTDDDLQNATIDEFGAKYSPDGKRLLIGSDIKEYKIKDGTNVICDNAFYECMSLQKIYIPSSVTAIGDYTFYGCISLDKIILPINLNKIGINSFVGIGTYAPMGCKILNKSSYFTVKDYVLYNSDMSILISYLAEQSEFTIPHGVATISNYAFYECSLKKISIPSSVISIGDFAFSECKSLEEVSIPSSVTTIGIGAFSECTSMQEISIPPNITIINNLTFGWCSSLKKIIIPSSVTTIGDYAFYGCTSLKNIVLPMKLNTIGINSFVGCKISSNSPDFIVIDDVLYNANRSIIISYLSEQTEFSIPLSVTTIGNSAFWGCSSLRKIYIPYSVTTINDSAFQGCSSLEEISIPSSVTSIGDDPFQWCNSLKKIIIPQGHKTRFKKMLPHYTNMLIEEKTILDDDLPF